MTSLQRQSALSMAALAHHIILDKRVVLRIRNTSMDEYMEELILIRKALLRRPGIGMDEIHADGLPFPLRELPYQLESLMKKIMELWLQ